LIKETTGGFDGLGTHDLLITSQTCNPPRPPPLKEDALV